MLTKEAIKIHQSAIVVDGHNDLPDKVRIRDLSSFKNFDLMENQPGFQTDIPRMLKGGVGAQFWVANGLSGRHNRGNSATGCCLEEIDFIYRMVERYSDVFELAFAADDILRIRKKEKIASLIGVEAGSAIESSLGVLRTYYRLGARYMTLTHKDTIEWVDSATDKPLHGGLSKFGEQVVLEMNRLGMLVDISHISIQAMHDVLKVSRSPIVASHSSAYALASTPRNVPDDVLKGIARNGGVVMINFFPGYLTQGGAQLDQPYWDYLRKLEKNPNLTETERVDLANKWDAEHPPPKCSVLDVVDHIEHVIKTAGLNHVGLGSDFEGIPFGPQFLEDVSYFPYITQGLLDRGYNETDIHKVLGGNIIRALREAENVASNLRKELNKL
ncbi:hypothetical protein BVY01_02980 [bacterium I07]|nr:hypothetical protein BVY01_02980 [bacterium I07]